MLRKMSLMDQCRGGGTTWALGSRMMIRSQMAKIGEDHVNLDHQMLKVMNGHLLLKRWGLMANSLEMMMWLGGMPQGPGEGMMLVMGKRSMLHMHIRIDRINRIPEPHQVWEQRDAAQQQEHVEHRNNVDWVSREPTHKQTTEPEHVLTSLHKHSSVHHQIQKQEGHQGNLKEQTKTQENISPETKPVK